MKKTVSFIILYGIILTSVFGNVLPTDNPYKQLYPDAYPSWTENLAWKKIVDISTYTPDSEGFWDDALVAAMQSLNNGGTVFFPAGTYKFKENVTILDGIILRGETPEFTDAKESNFAPPSRLDFPKYEPVFEGDGTPNSTAFKEILTASNACNIGLVYLDINRATIRLGNGASIGVLAFGVRSNNTATPQSDIPDKSIGQYGWQRFSWVFGVNIAASGYEKVSVVRCRANDLMNNTIHPIEDDSYDQPDYVVTGKFKGPKDAPDGATRETIENGVIEESDTTRITNGAWAKFNYLDHYGIRVSGREVNPILQTRDYNQQIELIDCWVLTTARVSYFAKGIGMVVRGNVKKDLTGKRTFIHPLGKSLQANNAATYENRGINFTGEKILIEDNDIEVERHRILYTPYSSVDGEGILIQWQDPWGSGGGSNGAATRINDVVIRNNRTNAYIGFWDVETPVSNVYITGNDLKNSDGIIFLKLENTHRIDNIHIEDNINLTGIDLNNSRGTTLGCNLYMKNNTGSGTITIGAQGIVENNFDFTVKTGATPSYSLYPTELFPYYSQLDVEKMDTMLVRFNKTIQLAATTGVTVEGEKSGAASVKKLYVNNDTLGIVVTTPFGEYGEKITVKVPANTVTVDSATPNEEISWFFVLEEEIISSVEQLQSFDKQLYVAYDRSAQLLMLSGLSGEKNVVEIFTVSGLSVKQMNVSNEETVYLPLALPPGVYIVRVKGSQGEVIRKFVS